MAHTPGQLTTTLILALSQSQEQGKILQHHAARIEQLGKENEKLRKELEEAKTKRDEHDHFKVDELFQRNVEHRAEILRLKQKLKKYKDKATGRLGLPISSPVSTATTPGSPRQSRARPPVEELQDDTGPPPAKRQRQENITSDLPLDQGDVQNVSTSTSRRGMIEKKIAAIPLLTEDGEDVSESNDVGLAHAKHVLNRDGSLYKRLDGLLAVPSPKRAPLDHSIAIDEQRHVMEDAPVPPRRAYNISNIHHVPRNSNSPTKSIAEKRSTPLRETPVTRATAQAREKLPPLTHPRSIRNGTALRNVPINRLKLTDFRPNPRWLDSHGVSFDDFLHGQNRARIEELAKTLPQRTSDEEILLNYMGAGSERTITEMTPVARSNMLEEAKIKQVASAFAKQRTDYDRENDPPGFWEVDMVSTQEQEKNRKLAIGREKAEIKRRYDDAMGGQGRFVFADEVLE